MTYKSELNKKIKKSGRKREWLSKQIGIPRTTFWRKVQSNALSVDEKAQIEKLLSK